MIYDQSFVGGIRKVLYRARKLSAQRPQCVPCSFLQPYIFPIHIAAKLLFLGGTIGGEKYFRFF